MKKELKDYFRGLISEEVEKLAYWEFAAYDSELFRNKRNDIIDESEELNFEV